MKLINLLGACFFIASFSQLSAQEITFSQKEPFPQGLVSIFPNNSDQSDKSMGGGNYFVVTGCTDIITLYDKPKKKNEKEPEPEIVYYENNVLLKKNKLNLETPTGKATFMAASSSGDESIVLLRQINKEYSRCYYQVYDKNCQVVSSPVLLNEQKLKEGFFGFFSYSISENKQFISLEYLLINSEDIFDREISYEIVDRNFKSLDKGSFKSIGLKPDDKIVEKILCNDGSYLIGVEYKQLDNKGRETNYLDRCTVYKKHLGKPSSSWEFKIPYTKVSEMNIFVSEHNDNLLYLAGIGFEEESRDSKIAFYVKYDLESKKELSQVKNTINFETFMYEPNKIFEQKNGVVFVTERVFGGASTTMSTNTGTASTTPKDYFNTVLCFKVEEGSETVPWYTVIDKEQVFITSLGLSNFGSIKVINTDESCFIFFNDNVANYNEQGQYIANEKNLNKFDGKQEKKIWLDDKGFAMAKLNLNDGTVERKLIVRNKGIVKLNESDCFISTNHSALFFLQKGEIGEFGQFKF